jgi:hypothetical protein
MRNIIIKTVIKKRYITEFQEIVSIFPHKKLRASVLGPLIKLIPIKAIPRTRENITLIEILGEKSPRSAIGPINNAEIKQKIMAVISGLILNNTPNTAPAKAECDIATPIKGMLRIIIQTPIIPQVIPPKNEAITAR